MGLSYPPLTNYPKGLDSDVTLYKVFNTAETTLSADLDPYNTTIYINPVAGNKEEIWAENGFVNINGELIYYASVAKDAETNKISTLLNCIRNMGGNKPVFYSAGTYVRGYVLAEHHNQLARSVVNLESFVGFQNTTDKTTLDWRIRSVNSLLPIVDDFACPDVNFNYTTISKSNILGTTIEYSLDIIGDNYTFVIDFGDGETNSTDRVGVHTYAPNSVIDPIVTVTNPNCEQAISGLIRQEGNQPLGATAPQPFEIPIPSFPTDSNLDDGVDVPNIVPDQIPQPTFVLPCVDASFGPIVVPSVIVIDDLNIPSRIPFTPIYIPSNIDFLPSNAVLPSEIIITPTSIDTDIDLIDSNLCITCTPEMILEESSITGLAGAFPYFTLTKCCDAQTQARITNVTVNVHGFQLGNTYDYGWIKMLVESPSGKNVLLMGSGATKKTLTNKITFTFSDSATQTIYPILPGNGTYLPSANGFQNTRGSGYAYLRSPAPDPPYGTKLSAFIDEPLTDGFWKVYLLTGEQGKVVNIDKV